MIIWNLTHLQVLSIVLEGKNIPVRPTKFGKKFDLHLWNVKDIMLELEDVKAKKNEPRKMTCWVLCKAIAGVAAAQNAERDFLPIAWVAKVEEKIVSGYRQCILNENDSEMWLQSELEKIARKCDKGKPDRYKFLDGISVKESVEKKPEVKLSNIVKAMKMDRAYREEKDQVADLLDRMHNVTVSHVMPWMKRLTKEVVNQLNETEKVSSFKN